MLANQVTGIFNNLPSVNPNVQGNNKAENGSHTDRQIRSRVDSQKGLSDKPLDQREIKQNYSRKDFPTRIETRYQPNCLKENLSAIQDKTTDELLDFINRVDRLGKNKLTASEALYEVYQELNLTFDDKYILSHNFHNRFTRSKEVERPLLATTRKLCETYPNTTLGDMINSLENRPAKELTIEEQNWLRFLNDACEFEPDTSDTGTSNIAASSKTDGTGMEASIGYQSEGTKLLYFGLGLLILFSHMLVGSTAPVLNRNRGTRAIAGSAGLPAGPANAGNGVVNIASVSNRGGRFPRAGRSVDDLVADHGKHKYRVGEPFMISCFFTPSNAAIGKYYWKSVKEGKVICRCDDPKPVYWHGSELHCGSCPGGVAKDLVGGNVSLVVDSAHIEMSGKYTCGVNDQSTGSTVPHADDSGHITILENINCEPQHVNITLGDKIAFKCSVERNTARGESEIIKVLNKEIVDTKRYKYDSGDRFVSLQSDPDNPVFSPLTTPKNDLSKNDIITCQMDYGGSLTGECQIDLSYNLGIQINAPEVMSSHGTYTVRCYSSYVDQHGTPEEIEITVNEQSLDNFKTPNALHPFSITNVNKDEFTISTYEDIIKLGSIRIRCLMKYKGLTEHKEIVIPRKSNTPFYASPITGGIFWPSIAATGVFLTNAIRHARSYYRTGNADVLPAVGHGLLEAVKDIGRLVKYPYRCLSQRKEEQKDASSRKEQVRKKGTTAREERSDKKRKRTASEERPGKKMRRTSGEEITAGKKAKHKSTVSKVTTEANEKRSVTSGKKGRFDRKAEHEKPEQKQSTASKFTAEANKKRSVTSGKKGRFNRKAEHEKPEQKQTAASKVKAEANKKGSVTSGKKVRFDRKAEHEKPEQKQTAASKVKAEANKKRSVTSGKKVRFDRKAEHAKLEQKQSTASKVTAEANKKRSVTSGKKGRFDRKAEHEKPEQKQTAASKVKAEANKKGIADRKEKHGHKSTASEGNHKQNVSQLIEKYQNLSHD